MNYYNYNLEQLKKYKKNLYDKILQLEDLIIDEDIESVQAKDGNRYIQIKKDNKVIRLNSNYRPVDQAKKWVEQYKLNDMYQVITMFGLGNGMFVRELLNKVTSTDMILIYEPSKEIFIHALHSYDLSDIIVAENISLSIEGINDAEFHNVIQQAIYWINLHSQVLCQHPQYIELFEESYLNFLKEIKAQNERTIVNRNTVGYLGVYESKNTIKNIKYIKESNTVMELYDRIPKHIPAIIVAAGPSLDKNVETLKKAKGKSVIISTDRALNVLLNHEIEPDFIITLDPIKPLEYFTTREDIDIPLMYRIEANPEILDHHKGRKFIFHSERFIKNIYDRLNKSIADLNPGGSVATAAFSVCVSLGFEHIILVGQDLAYGSNNLTHAGEKNIEDRYDEGIMVQGIDGNMVKTRFDWISFINWFQDAIALYNNIDVIDATEGGAKIEGSRIMTLQQVVDNYCTEEIDCNKIVEDLPLSMSESDVKILTEYIEKSIYDLDNIKRSVQELLSISDKLITQNRRGVTSDIDKLTNKMSKINKQILKKDIYSLLDNYISKDRTNELDNIYKLTGDEVKDREITYEKSKQIYYAIKEAVDEVKPELQSALRKLKVK